MTAKKNTDPIDPITDDVLDTESAVDTDALYARIAELEAAADARDHDVVVEPEPTEEPAPAAPKAGSLITLPAAFEGAPETRHLVLGVEGTSDGDVVELLALDTLPTTRIYAADLG